jgi:hypothetical protein
MNKPGPLVAVIAATMVAFACDPKTPTAPNPPKPIAQQHATQNAAYLLVQRGD